jgi:hypothetical protein
MGHEPHHYTIFYVSVDDLAGHLKKAQALAGKTLVPPAEIPIGTFAWMQGPDGNTVGLWKPKLGVRSKYLATDTRDQAGAEKLGCPIILQEAL